jgi:hypothetical protein
MDREPWTVLRGITLLAAGSILAHRSEQFALMLAGIYHDRCPECGYKWEHRTYDCERHKKRDRGNERSVPA